MKTYVANVYLPEGKGSEHQYPEEVVAFCKNLTCHTDLPEEADVHVLFVARGAETNVTEEYEWVRDNARNVVAIVLSNKYRRFAPKELVWQDCVSLKHERDVEKLLGRLNAEEWVPSLTKEEKQQEREAKKVEREARKAEKAKIKEAKALRKYEEAVVQLIKSSVGDEGITLQIPEGAKTLNLRLVANWK